MTKKSETQNLIAHVLMFETGLSPEHREMLIEAWENLQPIKRKQFAVPKVRTELDKIEAMIRIRENMQKPPHERVTLLEAAHPISGKPASELRDKSNEYTMDELHQMRIEAIEAQDKEWGFM